MREAAGPAAGPAVALNLLLSRGRLLPVGSCLLLYFLLSGCLRLLPGLSTLVLCDLTLAGLLSAGTEPVLRSGLLLCLRLLSLRCLPAAEPVLLLILLWCRLALLTLPLRRGLPEPISPALLLL